MSGTVQSPLPGRDPAAVSREYLAQAANQEWDHVVALTSGGRDSLAAADAVWRWGEDYGLDLDAVCHVNTGAGLRVTRETVKQFADERDVEYLEARNDNPDETIAGRVLQYGWPSRQKGGPESGGHWVEWVNRKDRAFDDVVWSEVEYAD